MTTNNAINTRVENGVWTPTITFATLGTMTVTSSIYLNAGFWSRVDNLDGWPS